MQWSQWASGAMLGLRTAASQRLVANGASFYSQKTDTCTEEEWERKTKAEKPREPGVLELLLALDNVMTEWLGVCAWPQAPWQRAVKSCCMCLELLGHGLVWYGLCGLLLLLYLLTSESFYFHQAINIFLVLTADVLLVAPVKLAVQRPRPRLNTGTIPMSVSSVDKYAFPSGHASRCVALAAYFCYYMASFHWSTHLWYVWALVVSLSRVLIGRHHLSDVLAGILAGLFIFETVCRSGILLGV